MTTTADRTTYSLKDPEGNVVAELFAEAGKLTIRAEHLVLDGDRVEIHGESVLFKQKPRKLPGWLRRVLLCRG